MVWKAFIRLFYIKLFFRLFYIIIENLKQIIYIYNEMSIKTPIKKLKKNTSEDWNQILIRTLKPSAG